MRKHSETVPVVLMLTMLVISITVLSLLFSAAARKEREAARLTRAVLLCSSASEAFYAGDSTDALIGLLKELAPLRYDAADLMLPLSIETEPVEGISLELVIQEYPLYHTAAVRALDEDGNELYRLDCVKHKEVR